MKRISWQPAPMQRTIDQKQWNNVQYFNCLVSMATNEVRWIREIKSRTVVTN